MGRMMNIIICSTSSLSIRTMCAPKALPAKLPMAARMPTLMFIAPFLKKLAVANVVPQAALNFVGGVSIVRRQAREEIGRQTDESAAARCRIDKARKAGHEHQKCHHRQADLNTHCYDSP